MARILIGNIKGPQGAQGIQGPQGPVGATGPQGPMPDLINNALATEAGVAALDAVMGKALQDQINQLNSDLIYNGYCLNPDNATSILCVVNGWDENVINIPSDAIGSISILITAWVFRENVGVVTGKRNQALITTEGAVFGRSYENSIWSDWKTK